MVVTRVGFGNYSMLLTMTLQNKPCMKVSLLLHKQAFPALH